MAEEAKASDMNTTTKTVPEEAVAAALREDQGPEATLQSWQVNNFTKKGDNYACFVTSVEVTYCKSGQVHHKTYVVKMTHVLPPGLMADMVNEVFMKEVTWFFDIKEKMNTSLKNIGLREIRAAKAYYGAYEKGKELMIVEDLRQRGFKMFDRKRGMNKAHAVLVLQELGRLHAASLVMEKDLPTNDMTKTWDFLIDNVVKKPEYQAMFENMGKTQVDGTIKILQQVENYEHVIDWLEQIKDSFIDIFADAFESNSKFAVQLHGDCWNNNILFRYDEGGAPVEVMLVDFQVVRKASVAADLNYFLFSSFNGPDRKPNLDVYLKTYYEAFSHVLHLAKYPVPFTQDELQQEFRRMNRIGMFSAIFLIPIVLVESEDAMSIADMDMDNMDKFSKENQQKLIKMSENENSMLKPRFLDMFDELVENGTIPK